jgi:hypothetical protein
MERAKQTSQQHPPFLTLVHQSFAHDMAHDLVGALQDLVHATVAHVPLDIVVLQVQTR